MAAVIRFTFTTNVFQRRHLISLEATSVNCLRLTPRRLQFIQHISEIVKHDAADADVTEKDYFHRRAEGLRRTTYEESSIHRKSRSRLPKQELPTRWSTRPLLQGSVVQDLVPGRSLASGHLQIRRRTLSFSTSSCYKLDRARSVDIEKQWVHN